MTIMGCGMEIQVDGIFGACTGRLYGCIVSFMADVDTRVMFIQPNVRFMWNFDQLADVIVPDRVNGILKVRSDSGSEGFRRFQETAVRISQVDLQDKACAWKQLMQNLCNGKEGNPRNFTEGSCGRDVELDIAGIGQFLREWLFMQRSCQCACGQWLIVPNWVAESSQGFLCGFGTVPGEDGSVSGSVDVYQSAKQFCQGDMTIDAIGKAYDIMGKYFQGSVCDLRHQFVNRQIDVLTGKGRDGK